MIFSKRLSLALIVPLVIASPAVSAVAQPFKGQNAPFIGPSIPNASPQFGNSGNQELKSTKRQRPSAQHRKQLLAKLYDELNASRDEDRAKGIATAIEKVWMDSGSDTVDLLMGRSTVALQQKEFDLAAKILSSVVQIDPSFTEAWNKRALVHYLKEDYTKSLDDIRQVLARDPRHYRALQGLSLIFKEYGKNRAALKAIRKALKQHPFLETARETEKSLSEIVEGQGI